MAGEKTKFALTEFFNNLFANFGKLMLTNIIFALPLAVCLVLFYFIDLLAGLGGNFISLLAVIPIFPFFAGVTLVTVKMVRGEENINVFQTFLKGVKDNYKRFLIHGIVLYFAILFSYFSISLYSTMISQLSNSGTAINVMLYVFLVVSIVISVAFLFVFYYLPSMTVTFNMSMKTIYKNSALMSFGEFKHNIISTFGVAVFVLLCMTILLFAGNAKNALVIVIVTTLLLVLFVPSILSFIINSAVFPGMYTLITEKEKKITHIDKKVDNRKKGQFYDDNLDEIKNPAEEFLALDIDENDDGDEYIFFNGKMVKRSVILKMKKEQEENIGE